MTRRAGVVGWPIAHSKSPILHGHWLARYGIDGAYDAVAAPPEAFAETLARLAQEGWAGVNVTIPHKEAALALATTATPRAREIGAANTLVFGSGGAIHADNTDGYGFMENLREHLGADWRPDRPALVLGAGGASRAVLHSLAVEKTSEIRLVNRTRARAEAVAAALDLDLRVYDWAEAGAAMGGAGLIVNATSLGMKGAPALTLRFDGAAAGAVATDLVYTPLETPFLARARAEGLRVVDGLGMLIHQARPGFEAWFGVAPAPDEALRRKLLAA